jgi:arylsulfatase A-like enzyme
MINKEKRQTYKLQRKHIFLIIILFLSLYFFLNIDIKSQTGEITLKQENIEPTETKEKVILGEKIKQYVDNEIKNVIFITIDTLRADHLGFMGYPRNTSPFLDKLAKESFLFKNAYTVISSTNPSHASMFTSLYANQHKLTNNYEILDDSFITMAEFFKEKNFKTNAFVAIPDYFSRSNLDQGFDVFMGPENKSEISKEIVNLLIGSIANNNSDNNFLWAHFWEPHFPYQDRTSSDYVKKFQLSKEKEDKFIDFWTKEQGINKEIYMEPSKDIMIDVLNSYDTEILVVDREIERLYNYFEESGLNEKTLWIITIDHGEGLGSHNFYEHVGMLYEEQLLTPIIFAFPSSFLAEPKIIEDVVENIDILPTLAEIIGFSLNDQKKEKQGDSFLSKILTNSKSKSDKNVFSWSGNIKGGKRFKSPIGEIIKSSSGTGEKFSIQNKKYKYIYNLKKENEFYDLLKDPLENNNLINLDIEDKNLLKKLLLEKKEKLEMGSSDIEIRRITPDKF